jgi:hypothetical protein
MFRAIGTFFLCICLLTTPLLAYETELSDIAVREAYFLGQRNDDKMRAFFSPYTKHLPLPKKGPHVSEIRLQTPLAQVVQVSSQVTSGYSAQQAHIAYQKRGDTILLVVHLQLTATYGEIDAEHNAQDAANKRGLALRQDDFWEDFQYGLKQSNLWIDPHAIHGEAEYGDASMGSGLVGAWVYVEYDAHSVHSDDAEVHVMTIPGEEVTATFDLAKLR